MEEIWKDIEGFEGFYQVSNLGRVKSLARKYVHLNRWGTLQTHPLPERILTPSPSHDNYMSVALSKEGQTYSLLVHRLVAQAFISNPDNLPQVNHKDENPSNNCVDNLEWCSVLYNNNYGTRCKRLSAALKGRPFSEALKQKMKELRKGEGNPMYGRKQSDETRHKMSEAAKGKKKSPEHVAKMRERMLGHIPWNKGLHTKPITCLDANIEFSCADDAARWIGGISSEAVEYCLKREACCKGHVFVHSDNIPEDIESYVKRCVANYRKGTKAGRPCKCIEDNKVFKFVSEAARYYGVTHNDVYNRLDKTKGILLNDNRTVHFKRISFEEFEESI